MQLKSDLEALKIRIKIAENQINDIENRLGKFSINAEKRNKDKNERKDGWFGRSQIKTYCMDEKDPSPPERCNQNKNVVAISKTENGRKLFKLKKKKNAQFEIAHRFQTKLMKKDSQLVTIWKICLNIKDFLKFCQHPDKTLKLLIIKWKQAKSSVYHKTGCQMIMEQSLNGAERKCLWLKLKRC